MHDLLVRLSNVNRNFERAYIDWMKANDMGDPDPVLYPPFATDDLAALEQAAGAPLPDELKTLLTSNGARIGLGLGSASEVLGLEFAWLDTATIVEETKKLREAAEEYDWELPPSVPFSSESSEPVAYRLDNGQMITISAHDDGEVTELGLNLSEFLEKYVKAIETQVARGYAE